MRVVYFAHFAGGTDGSSATDADLTAALRARGVDVVVLAPFRRPTSFPGGSVAAARLRRLLLALPGYVRMVRAGLRLARDPGTRIASQYHVFHPATAVAFLVARLRGRPLVVRPHNLQPHSYRSRAEAVVNRALFRVYRPILRHRGTTLLVSSEEWRSQAAALGLPPERAFVLPDNVTPIPGPTDEERRRLRESLGVGDSRVVLKAGSFTKEGTAVFVGALRHLGRPEVKGVVVADAGWGDAFRGEARRQGVEDGILVLGPRANLEVRRLMALADVCVGLLTDHPMARGAVPRNTLEAMAAGRPVVLCRGVVASSLIEDGVNGLLVPPGDVAALADALARILGDARFAATLGREARRTIDTRFHSDVVAARLQAILEALPPSDR